MSRTLKRRSFLRKAAKEGTEEADNPDRERRLEALFVFLCPFREPGDRKKEECMVRASSRVCRRLSERVNLPSPVRGVIDSKATPRKNANEAGLSVIQQRGCLEIRKPNIPDCVLRGCGGRRARTVCMHHPDCRGLSCKRRKQATITYPDRKGEHRAHSSSTTHPARQYIILIPIIHFITEASSARSLVNVTHALPATRRVHRLTSLVSGRRPAQFRFLGAAADGGSCLSIRCSPPPAPPRGHPIQRPYASMYEVPSHTQALST